MQTDLLNLLLTRLRFATHHVHGALLALIESLRVKGEQRTNSLDQIVVLTGRLEREHT